MPIASSLAYVKGLLDGLTMPGSLPDMVAYITPPDPNVDTQIPTAYVWPDNGDEDRNPERAGSVPRNSGPGTSSGFKGIEHSMSVYVVWVASDEEPGIDSLFPGIVDAVMLALRTSADPATVTDPYTGQRTTLIDVGERLGYRITLRSLVEQAFDRYDSLISLSVLEVIQALAARQAADGRLHRLPVERATGVHRYDRIGLRLACLLASPDLAATARVIVRDQRARACHAQPCSQRPGDGLPERDAPRGRLLSHRVLNVNGHPNGKWCPLVLAGHLQAGLTVTPGSSGRMTSACSSP